MTPPISIKSLDTNADHTSWDTFVRAHPRGGMYHLSAWRDVIWNVFRQKQIYLQATDHNGAVVGALPLVEQKSRLFGHRLLSMPYFNYGGALGATPEIERALMDHAGTVASDRGASSVEFRDMIPREDTWPCRDEKILMILDLPETPEDLSKALGSKRRSQIRRAGKEEPKLLRGSGELLDDFYKVFAITMRDLGTPVYSIKFFREMIRAFPDNIELFVIHLNDEPVSAGFLVTHDGLMQIPWAGTLRKVNRLSMNMYLYWKVIESAIESGCRQFDFGRTTKGSGTHKFKAQWGAQPHQMHWHYWLAPGVEQPKLNPDNPKYQRVISAWQKLPVPLTKIIGPHLVKNLP